MFDKRQKELFIALITSGALIAFAFYQRSRTVPVSAVGFFVAAAAICLFPVLYPMVRHQGCDQKAQNRS